MKKKRALFMTVMLLLVFGLASVVSSAPVYFQGEGSKEPAPNSLVPFNPQLLLQKPVNSGRAPLAAGDTVTVNPLATNFPNIVLYVTVLDAAGNAVAGKVQGDFTLTEKSTTETSAASETITSFAESRTGSGISVALVFDVSGSMAGTRLADSKTAAINFINNCGPNDRVALVKFSNGLSSPNQVEVVMPSNWVSTDNNHNGTLDIIEAINSLTELGWTALYDGTGKGIETLSQEPAPKAVVVFTDGEENDSGVYTINTVIQKAQNEGTPLFTIGLGIDPQNLKDMATATGGNYHYAPNAQDMAAIYNSIAQNLRSQYTIGYTTHNPAFDGTTRTVTVASGGASGSGVYVVNHRPDITLDSATLALSAQSQQPNTDLTVAGFITDNDAYSRSQTVTATLYYKTVSAAAYTSVPLTLPSVPTNNRYAFSGTIPAAAVQEPGVLYYLHATDGVQEIFSPFNYGTLPHSIPVLNRAPTIVHTPITSSMRNQAVPISAEVTDPDSGGSINQVLLYYRIHDPNQNTPYFSIGMTSVNGVQYSATIPADNVTVSGVDYFISAWDNYLVRSDKGSATSPYFIGIGAANIVTDIVPPANCSPFLSFTATMSVQ